RRQDQFRQSEIHALMDTAYFIDRAKRLYDYPHFICDTGGSICEWVNPNDPDDPILTELSDQTLMVWIKGDEAHTADLVRRFDAEPKPMAYQGQFLDAVWTEYLVQTEQSEEDVDPDAFIRWTYAQALAHRQPRYEAMARNWGITVEADTIAECRDEADFVDVIAQGLADGAAAA
ncbi:MAG: ATPase, partial [Rhodobacteraceae bacterium]|nr:ATPase [Paracoccaceae bacterium]